MPIPPTRRCLVEIDDEQCPRREAAKGKCSSHYRQWRAGEPYRPIRTYRRYDEGPGGECVPAPEPVVVAKPAPFASELRLLRDLGLR